MPLLHACMAHLVAWQAAKRRLPCLPARLRNPLAPCPTPAPCLTLCPRPLAAHQVKLISEPWDIGAYMVGSWPNWDVWAEWNGKYRDDVRRFLR